jgi:hypothetical protein
MGSGAAAMRIEVVRKLFPKCWFNEVTTEAGRDALGYYHEKKDEARDVGLGPEHDWSTHAADAFGLMAIARRMAVVRVGSNGIANDLRCPASRLCFADVVLSASHFDNS